METSKQKAIREAWVKIIGIDKYNKVNDLINENGWFINDCCSIEQLIKDVNDIGLQINDVDILEYNWRPKSLQGIETNNGWIKIKSEEDLPKEIYDYWVLRKNETTPRLCKWLNISVEYHTHYQPIIKPLKPIY